MDVVTGGPPFLPSQTAVCDRERSAGLKGAFCSPAGRLQRGASRPPRPVCMHTCVCILHAAAPCHTHMPAFVSLPHRSHEQGLPGKKPEQGTLPPHTGLGISVLQTRSLDKTGEITSVITPVPEPSSPAIYHWKSGL